MHSFCCCSKVNSVPLRRRRSLTSSQSCTSRKADSTIASSSRRPAPAGRMDADAEEDVLVDRDRQRVGPLEDHAHRFPQLGERDVRIVDVLAQDRDLAGGRHVAVPLIDAVERAEQRRLTAARGPDQRRNQPRLDVDRHIAQRLEVPIP